jgi:protein-tyrosine phosphatase
MGDMGAIATTGMPEIPGLANFRDIGGLPVAGGGHTRYRTLYRSHALHGLDARGMAGVRALGLRTLLDLRDADELVQWPYEFDDPATIRLHVPVLGILPVPDGQEDLYVHMIGACGDGFTEAVRVLARPEALPALVHCAIGKDRTGIAVALALSAVGVPDEAIVTDYVKSNAGLGIPEPGQPMPADRYVPRYVAADLMVGALAHARGLGGDVPGYLALHGMADDELDALRANLIEPPALGLARPDRDTGAAEVR